MINLRLMWYLEVNNILTETQSGFHLQRSTIDQLVRLESIVRQALIRSQRVVAIFFYIEKAYDTTWKYGIMRDLQESGLRGRLPNFMSFKIRMGNLLSSNYEQEAAVPQGSILSTTLFILELTTPYMVMIY